MNGAFRLGVIAAASRRGSSGPEPTGDYPQWLGVTPTVTTRTSTHAVNLPAEIDAGDLLVMLISHGETRTVTVPGGWTAAGSAARATGAGSVTSLPVYRVASGGEGATQSVSYSGSCYGVYQVHRIAAGTFDPADPIARATAIEVTSPPFDYPELAPGWGVVPTLWLAAALFSRDGGFVGVTYPYPSGNTLTYGSASALFPAMLTSYAEITAATADPGTSGMTSGSFAYWITETLAIKPAL